jgi:PadR family transcriptional regulator PadR
MEDVRMTVAVATVLRAFLAEPAEPAYGYNLMQVTGYPSGKLYPILARLSRAGWLIREREDIDPAAEGRPVRYLYRIDPRCVAEVRQELVGLAQQLRPAPSPPGRLAPGRSGT